MTGAAVTATAAAVDGAATGSVPSTYYCSQLACNAAAAPGFAQAVENGHGDRGRPGEEEMLGEEEMVSPIVFSSTSSMAFSGVSTKQSLVRCTNFSSTSKYLVNFSQHTCK